ncbi:hypothetical protein D7X12_19995 [Corallococcus sicarius]|uniref:Uncharacterized protein n=1 Tax=Corallococcus sicarius TaxID=2316726 RepID=A0A3A8NA08_9BACT|nr:hypothetical protein D7X12_19995 [Corallococcus sicarius]
MTVRGEAEVSMSPPCLAHDARTVPGPQPGMPVLAWMEASTPEALAAAQKQGSGPFASIPLQV